MTERIKCVTLKLKEEKLSVREDLNPKEWKKRKLFKFRARQNKLQNEVVE